MKKTGFLTLSLMLIIAFASCSSEKRKVTKEKFMTQKEDTFQNQEDLLHGMHSAICYSGFREGQHPDRGEGAKNPSREQILEDLNIIVSEMDYNLIRMYDCGENTQATLRIIKEENLDIKVMLGVWLKAELSAHETCSWLTEPIPQDILDKNKVANLQELEKGIALANQFKDIVVAVSVGNESLVEWNDHKMDVDTVISYCSRVKERIQQPVTVADNYEWWANHGAKLAKALDFISIHIYPVWEEKGIDEGLSYSIENIEKVRTAIPDSRIVITEAGWATTAVEFGDRASEENQQRYNSELMAWTERNNITTFLFEAFDEPWKGETANADGAEKHWGVYFENRKPKLFMKNRK